MTRNSLYFTGFPGFSHDIEILPDRFRKECRRWDLNPHDVAANRF